MKFLNGDEYEGNYENGVQTGHGVYIWKNGDKYEGNFEKNIPQGMGKKYFADGRYYEGEFQNGKIVNEQNIVMRNIKEENNLIDNGLEFTNNISLKCIIILH